MMTLYYRDDAVQVTSESIRAGGHVVALADVTFVWHARAPRPWRCRVGCSAGAS
ncbi:hypothetical protein GCM10027614_64070 [Micromonospora vulcania]